MKGFDWKPFSRLTNRGVQTRINDLARRTIIARRDWRIGNYEFADAQSLDFQLFELERTKARIADGQLPNRQASDGQCANR